MQSIPLKNFVVTLGWNDFSQSITRQLLASSNQVVALVREEETRLEVDQAFESDDLIAIAMNLSDYPSMKEMGVGRGRSIFVNTGEDEKKLITILRMQNHFPDLDYMVVLEDEELEDTFRSAGVTYAISKFSISSKVLASYLYEPDVAEYTEKLLTATETEQDYDMQQYRVTATCDAAGASFGEALRYIRDEHGAVAVGLKKQDGPLLKVPGPEAEIAEGDYILLATRGASEAGLEDFFGVQEGVLNETSS